MSLLLHIVTSQPQVQYLVLAELIGHEQGFTLSTYAPMELPASALQELIERIRYEGLDLDHLHV
jgi:hypothetical protein